MFPRNFQDKMNSLRGSVENALQKLEKRGRIKGFKIKIVQVRKNTSKAVSAAITLPTTKEISVDFLLEDNFDFKAIVKRLNNIIDTGK
ncbi:MAG: hypothetical protein AB1333_00855 [Patescibacteria group bacterium]